MGDGVRLARAIIRAKRVYLCGNGGSGANAIHIANDLVAMGVKAMALTADIATLTAIANDYGYEQVFARQIRTFGEEGDLLIALSGSGNSRNILAALEAANAKKMLTWLISGAYNEGGAAKDLAKKMTLMGRDMQEAEERQIIIGHSAMRYIRDGE